MVLGSSTVAVTSPSDFASASSKEFFDIQAFIECGVTLKRVRDMTRTYSQCKHWPFINFTLLFQSVCGFKGIQAKNYCIYTLLTQNITTNQCKNWRFLLLLHHNSINIQGLQVYK